MGPRYRLRWAVRQPRVWAVVGAWLLVTLLTVDDRRPWWTGAASLVTFVLASLAIRVTFAEDHPDHEERLDEREPPPEGERPGSRKAKRAARERARVDELLARYEAERAERAAPPGRHSERR